MPTVPTPVTDPTTGLTLTNTDAEIVDALIIEDVSGGTFEVPVTIPAVVRPDCLICGQDYVIRPGAAVESDDPTTMLIDGCECEGCDALRVLATPVDEAAPVDPTPYLAPVSVTVSHGPSVPATIREAVLCPDCVTNAAGWNPLTCSYCSEYLAPDLRIAPTIMSSGSFGERLSAAVPGRIVGLNVGVAPLRTRVGSRSRTRSWYLRTPVMTDELNVDGITECVCENCYDSAQACDCGVLITANSEYFCDECDDGAMCHGCFTAAHQHREANTLEDARIHFRPRATVGGALAFTGVPGETIVSTRALGIEVETARGDAAAVVRAEAMSPVPVIAQLGSDGSVRGRGAVEYRLLPLRGMWAEYALRAMAEWCREAGYRPDSSAGIHMHVDAGDLSPVELYQALAVLVSLDDVLFAHATSDRRNSTYCVPFREAERAVVVERAMNYARNGSRFTYEVTGDSRYRSVNSHAYAGHGTLEVRVFDSCHDVAAVERFTDAAAIIAGAVDFARLDAFRDLLGAWPTLADADVTLARMAEAGCITNATALRAIARLRESAPASVAA